MLDELLQTDRERLGFCGALQYDNLMTDALTIGAQQEQHCISAEIVMAAANNQALT